jgi:hypothetical protein
MLQQATVAHAGANQPQVGGPGDDTTPPLAPMIKMERFVDLGKGQYFIEGDAETKLYHLLDELGFDGTYNFLRRLILQTASPLGHAMTPSEPRRR